MIHPDEDLEDYQKPTVKHKNLNRYDKFYRIVGVPFIEINVIDFF